MYPRQVDSVYLLQQHELGQASHGKRKNRTCVSPTRSSFSRRMAGLGQACPDTLSGLTSVLYQQERGDWRARREKGCVADKILPHRNNDRGEDVPPNIQCYHQHQSFTLWIIASVHYILFHYLISYYLYLFKSSPDCMSFLLLLEWITMNRNNTNLFFRCSGGQKSLIRLSGLKSGYYKADSSWSLRGQ